MNKQAITVVLFFLGGILAPSLGRASSNFRIQKTAEDSQAIATTENGFPALMAPAIEISSSEIPNAKPAASVPSPPIRESVPAPQTPNSSLSQQKKKLIFFGGYGSSPSDMSCWKKGVDVPGLEITAISYPQGVSFAANTEIQKTSEFKKVLAEIKTNPGRKFQVAGHSSGSQYANQLVEKMLAAGVPAKNIELVNLDGFRADPELSKKVKTTCWSATNGQRVRSSNYNESCKIHRAPKCYTKWCLHFSLVNLETSGGSGVYGKRNCKTNTQWITPGSEKTNFVAGKKPGTSSTGRN